MENSCKQRCLAAFGFSGQKKKERRQPVNQNRSIKGHLVGDHHHRECLAINNCSKNLLGLDFAMEICFAQYLRMHISRWQNWFLGSGCVSFKQESPPKHKNSRHNKDIRDSVVSAKKSKSTVKENLMRLEKRTDDDNMKDMSSLRNCKERATFPKFNPLIKMQRRNYYSVIIKDHFLLWNDFLRNWLFKSRHGKWNNW